MASIIDQKHWYKMPGPVKYSASFIPQGDGINPNARCEQFMAEDLAKSGLTPADVNAAPKYMLERSIESAAYIIPYYDVAGNVLRNTDNSPSMFRIRRELTPDAAARGRVGKYSQPSHEELGELAVYPYLHHKLWECEESDTLLICEGEKKTAAAVKHLGLPALGIGGCHNWRAPGNRVGDRVHPAIVEVIRALGVSRVAIVPDGDIDRYDIARAYGTFAALLTADHGLEVTILKLPHSDDKLDDLIVEWGSEAKERFNELEPSQSFVETPVSLARRYNLATEQRGRGDNARQVPMEHEGNVGRLLQLHPQFQDIWYDKDMSYYMVGDRPLVDMDLLDILTYFQMNFGMAKVRPHHIYSSLGSIQAVRSCSPFMDKVRAVKWDGTPRLERMFIDYCSVPESPLALEVGRKWLPAAIRRVLHPGSLLDYMVIATGGQGIGKSSFPRILWGKGVVDFLGHHDSKDQAMLMHRGYCVNWEELSQMGRKDIAQLKALVSAKFDTFRAPYDKTTEERPRRFVMYGSVNNPEFLSVDPTGQRRYAVLEFGQVQFDKLEADRNQLWAEAYHIYQGGCEAGDDFGNVVHADAAARKHVMSNPHYESLVEALTQPGKQDATVTVDVEGTPHFMFKLAEAAQLAGLGDSNLNSWPVDRLRECMLANGWVKHDTLRRDGAKYRNVFIVPCAMLEGQG